MPEKDTRNGYSNKRKEAGDEGMRRERREGKRKERKRSPSSLLYSKLEMKNQ